MTPLLDVRGLSTEFVTTYGVVRAVNDVSFQVEQGEALGIVGESGSGKSVTMLSVMGLIESPPGRVTGGEVLLGGVDLRKLPAKDLRALRGGQMAMIFQDPLTSLNPVFTIGDQLREAIQMHRPVSRAAARRRAAECLEMVGIPDPARALDDYPHQFSGGMRQRAMIAMALSCEPRLLSADEPTTALDVTVQEQLLELIENLRRQFDMTVIWITHDLGVVAGIADRVMVMYAGRVAESGPVETIFAQPRHPYTVGLLKSIPRLDVVESGDLEIIPGSPPDLIRLPPGCAFAPRCRYRVAQCETERPMLAAVGPGHESACWVNPTTTAGEADRREERV
jgi:oligopeptide transport system ATP-binding protein